MPYLPTSQSWLQQSSLLLQAQPTSVRLFPSLVLFSATLPNRASQLTNPPFQTQTRIITKYTLTPPSSSSSTSTSTSKRRKTNDPSSSSHQPPTTTTDPPLAQSPQQQSQQQQPQATKGTLELKTYDPATGVCLKYRTDKAAEVGRLVASLGRLGRYMSGVEVKEEEQEEGDGGGEGTSTPVVEMGVVGKEEGKGKDGKAGVGGEKGKVGGASGGGGGGKKRKGKR